MFYSGWGFTENSFDLLKPHLGCIPENIVIAHSFGIVEALNTKASNIIAIGSFKQFNQWPPRVIEKMLAALQQNQQQVLQRFYKQCGVTTYKPTMQLDKSMLEAQLKQLVRFQYTGTKAKIICIHGAQDAVTPADNAIKTPYIIDDAGHCPHITHPKQCAEIIHAAL